MVGNFREGFILFFASQDSFAKIRVGYYEMLDVSVRALNHLEPPSVDSTCIVHPPS